MTPTMNPRPFPMHDHPLTQLYIDGATARDYGQMRSAMVAAAALEKELPEQTKAACKLAAEVCLERLPKSMQALDWLQ